MRLAHPQFQMKVEVVTAPLGQVKADALVVGLSSDDKRLPPSLRSEERRVGKECRL